MSQIAQFPPSQTSVFCAKPKIIHFRAQPKILHVYRNVHFRKSKKIFVSFAEKCVFRAQAKAIHFRAHPKIIHLYRNVSAAQATEPCIFCREVCIPCKSRISLQKDPHSPDSIMMLRKDTTAHVVP